MLLILFVRCGKKSFPSLSQSFVESNESRGRRILVAAVDTIRSEDEGERCDNNPNQRRPVSKLNGGHIDFGPGLAVICVEPLEGEIAIPLDPPEPLPDEVALGATGAPPVCLLPPIACCRWAVVKPFFK
jgi:hypothetical protein